MIFALSSQFQVYLPLVIVKSLFYLCLQLSLWQVTSCDLVFTPEVRNIPWLIGGAGIGNQVRVSQGVPCPHPHRGLRSTLITPPLVPSIVPSTSTDPQPPPPLQAVSQPRNFSSIKSSWWVISAIFEYLHILASGGGAVVQLLMPLRIGHDCPITRFAST